MILPYVAHEFLLLRFSKIHKHFDRKSTHLDTGWTQNPVDDILKGHLSDVIATHQQRWRWRTVRRHAVIYTWSDASATQQPGTEASDIKSTIVDNENTIYLSIFRYCTKPHSWVFSYIVAVHECREQLITEFKLIKTSASCVIKTAIKTGCF